ncbi:HPP family protein [Paraburkholderia kururiensis]|uniref:HPP family protein n=1 Tax=Paraburkholderia kururiensis TaxID=984307 RepID=UPI002D7F1A96|nr:HPP family protein [Paraburkholderia kururiensis]
MSRSVVTRWFASFMPATVAIRWSERVRSAVGALVGIALTGTAMRLLLPASEVNVPLLVAPMGASAVLLFGVPASPLAQPWSIMGGNLVSAVVGVTCATLIANPVYAAATAVALAICAMFALRCVHPPSGAVALTAVLGGPAIHALGYGFVLAPIATQSAVLLGAAIVYHNLTGHRYPHAAPKQDRPVRAPGVPAPAQTFARADLEAVLRGRSELLDIDTGDLEALLRDVQLQAWSRSFDELTCADVMSRDVVTVSSGTSAWAALKRLERYNIKALPVVDERRHVAGIVTRADLARARPRKSTGWWGTSMALVPGFGGRAPAAQRAATAGSLMSRSVHTVHVSTPIADLVPVFAHYGHHHIPVLDNERRLAGIITQADLIAGLYRQTSHEQRLAA